MNDSLRRMPSANGHQDGIEYRFTAQRWGNGPTDDLPRKQIHDDSQVQPSFPGPDVGNVGNPSLVRRADLKLSLQNIWSEAGWLGTGLRPATVASYGTGVLPRFHGRLS